MRRSTSLILLAVLVAQVYSAPQLISFKDGKLGVNFGGYHAGVGLGGLMGGSGTAGGLFAEAGTPNGPAAKAGLGGAVDANGGSAGGLFAGATAGGNVKASAGLAGGVTAEKAAGTGYASAQAGNHYASSGLGGQASGGESSGFSFSGSNGLTSGVLKETEVVPNFQAKPVHKKLHTEFNVDAANEVNAVPLTTVTKTEIQPAVIVKEVQYVQPQTVQKQIIRTHYKPNRHHFRKTAYIGGYIGDAKIGAPPQPAIEKRIDVGSDVSARASATGDDQVFYTKQVSYQRNPNFFADIFNIPISTLKAVGSFLGNAAGNTNVSVEKSATLQAESDTVSSKHAPLSSVSSSETHVSVQTPTASKIIDDIFAIPINTLGAVNKFLENNVSARRKIQVSQDGVGEPTRIHLGPHARRRANKHVVVIHENIDKSDSEPKQ